MFSRGTTPEIRPGDQDRVFGFGLAFFNETGIGSRQTDEGEAAELLIFEGLGGDEGEVLGRDDLVGIDVVLDNETGTIERFCGNQREEGTTKAGKRS